VAQLAKNAKKSGKNEILVIACYQGKGELGNKVQDLADLSNMPVQYTKGEVRGLPFIGPFTIYPDKWYYVYPRSSK